MTFVEAGLIGLLYLAAPGPVNIETLRRGLRGGFWDALGVQLGAVVGRTPYALVALAGLEVLARTVAIHLLLGLIGAGLLLAMGWSAVRQGWSQERLFGLQQVRTAQQDMRRTVGRGALFGAAISLANPFAVVFWFAVGGTVLEGAPADAASGLSGFLLGSLLWAIGLPALLSVARPALGHHVHATYRAVSVVCGLALIAFGLALGQAVVDI